MGQNQCEHAGARALKNAALLLLIVTAIGWICGFIAPSILAPVYLAVACCMYLCMRHVRLMAAVTMLSHLACTLLQCVMHVPLWASGNPAQRFDGVMELAYNAIYLTIVAYLYISPSIAEYYQDRHR